MHSQNVLKVLFSYFPVGHSIKSVVRIVVDLFTNEIRQVFFDDFTT